MQPDAIPRLDGILESALYVADLDRSVHFYQSLFGFPIVDRGERLVALAAADRLTAKLLIIHGTADDNVHMQNTMNFIDALVKAGKPHEIQIQPGQSHGFSGDRASRFLNERIVDFFQRNL